MAELKTNLGLAVRMYEFGAPPPRIDMFVIPHACATRGDAGRGRRAGHFSKDKPGPALSPSADMHDVAIPRYALDGRLHGHRRDNDPILQLHFAKLEGCEHGPSRLFLA